jgi:hypothetical protein
MTITVESLKAVSYLDVTRLGDGRTVNLMPLWDGTNWRVWLNTAEGLIEGKMMDVVEGDYVAQAAAKPSDLFIPFVHLMWQRASWPEICPLIVAICDDFHNLGTSVAKLRHFFDAQSKLPPRAASRFAYTEIEYLTMLCRAVFDLLQEMIAETWYSKVQLNDSDAERRRRASKLPETFSRVVLLDKKVPRTVAEIENKFGLPKQLAEQYAKIAPFFLRLRNVRDDVVHRGKSVGLVFDTERGFCVNPKVPPFSLFTAWQQGHYYNENLVSLLPWIADTVMQTIDACNSLMMAFGSVIALPPEVAPGYTIFVRGPHNESLVELLNVRSGASPWWGGAA